jgi:hypothetical protein
MQLHMHAKAPTRIRCWNEFEPHQQAEHAGTHVVLHNEQSVIQLQEHNLHQPYCVRHTWLHAPVAMTISDLDGSWWIGVREGKCLISSLHAHLFACDSIS